MPDRETFNRANTQVPNRSCALVRATTVSLWCRSMGSRRNCSGLGWGLRAGEKLRERVQKLRLCRCAADTKGGLCNPGSRASARPFTPLSGSDISSISCPGKSNVVKQINKHNITDIMLMQTTLSSSLVSYNKDRQLSESGHCLHQGAGAQRERGRKGRLLGKLILPVAHHSKHV